MSVHELFEIIEDLCAEHGIDKVEATIYSMFEMLKEKGTSVH